MRRGGIAQSIGTGGQRGVGRVTQEGVKRRKRL